MKIFRLGTVMAAALSLAAVSAFAQNTESTQSNTQNPQSTQSQNEGINQAGQPGEMPTSGASEQPGQTAAGTSATTTLTNNPQAQMMVAPHSLMVQSQLQSAKALIGGLRAQLAAESGTPDKLFLKHAKIYKKDIGQGIRTAMVHDNELKKTLEHDYPAAAQSSAAQSTIASVNQVDNFYKTWERKAGDLSYWKNKQQAEADLSVLSSRIDHAITQTRNFNTNELALPVA